MAAVGPDDSPYIRAEKDTREFKQGQDFIQNKYIHVQWRVDEDMGGDTWTSNKLQELRQVVDDIPPQINRHVIVLRGHWLVVNK